MLHDPLPYLFLVAVLSIFLSLFISAASFAPTVYTAFLWYQSPRLWQWISLICFTVGVSGSIFCIIRNAPPLGWNRLGQLVVFAPQGRDQYLIEGLVVALWTILAGASLYLLLLTSKIRFFVLRHVLVILTFSAFLVAIVEIGQAYILKTPWYSIKETFPPALWFYLTSAVKKNSDIFKRLWRLSEYWLLEAKDLHMMQKKIQSLLIDFLIRQGKVFQEDPKEYGLYFLRQVSWR